MPRRILSEFKSLLHKYQHVFHLPNSPLSTIKGFSHNIPTGDSPPVYRLPYRKSPAELAAIKIEIERMLQLNVIPPSHSAWGAPCTLVRKPLEKGKPQTPRFVVDYRGKKHSHIWRWISHSISREYFGCDQRRETFCET